MPKPTKLPDTIITTCKLFGINPPRLLTKKDISSRYPGMPLVTESIWQNVKEAQKGLASSSK
jgi:hypothetical protein